MNSLNCRYICIYRFKFHSHPVTLESFKRHEEEDPWLQIDVILMATLLGLLGTLLTLICYTVLQKIRQHFRKTKYKYDYYSIIIFRIFLPCYRYQL